MATVKSYMDSVPHSFFERYKDEQWVVWANSLLERLSGSGILLPQRLSRSVTVRDGMWVDKPPMCRDVLELRRSAGGGTP